MLLLPRSGGISRDVKSSAYQARSRREVINSRPVEYSYFAAAVTYRQSEAGSCGSFCGDELRSARPEAKRAPPVALRDTERGPEHRYS